MKQVTFEKHVLKSDETRPGVNWRRDLGLPAIDSIELIKAVGFDATKKVALGLLEHNWTHDGKFHPYHAIVLAPDINLLPSDEFFVSNETFEEVRN